MLSKLDKAGFGLRDIEPLLYVIEDSGLVGATGELAAPILPFLQPPHPRRHHRPAVGALNVPSPVYALLAAGSAGRAAAISRRPTRTCSRLPQTPATVFGAVTPALFLVLAAAASFRALGAHGRARTHPPPPPPPPTPPPGHAPERAPPPTRSRRRPELRSQQRARARHAPAGR